MGNSKSGRTAEHDAFDIAQLENFKALSDAQLLEFSTACIKARASRLFRKCEAERVRRVEWRQAHG